MATGRKHGDGIVENFWFKYTLSAVAAAVAETATYPLDITKTRLQIQGEKLLFAVRHDVKIKNMQSRGMIQTACGIMKHEGIMKLWQGVTPAIYRHLVYTGCRMTLYEFIRERILKKKPDGTISLWKAVVGGSIAGGLGQFIASPTDLVKVQMQMEGQRKRQGLPPRVRSTWHAFTKIVTEGGIRGLWKGWVPNVQRAALVNLGELATYDTSKHLILKHTTLKDNYITHAIASSCSGLVAATLGTPADVIKTRVMNQQTDAKGRGQLYSSSLDCLSQTIQKEGFMALYKGFIPIWTRMAPWSLTFWLTYEELRRLCGVSSF